MYSFESLIGKVNKAIGKNGLVAFLATVIIGLFSHAPAMILDAPNHDGLASMYFDQNMITSGRWFLGIACGISSYFSIPWLISILSLVYLGITAILIIKLLKVTTPVFIVLISGLLVSFPAIVSNFAYVFTMDGYMIGLMLSVLAAFLVDKHKLGFVFGGIALAFSMGVYQAYLPITILLSLYLVLMILAGNQPVKDKLLTSLRYLYMGIIGAILYYIILKIMLLLQGKVLDSYQGISDAAGTARPGLLSVLKRAYSDFVVFSVKGNIIFSNKIALAAVILFGVAFAIILIGKALKEGWVRSVWFYVIILATALALPLCTNVILFVSTEVTYHLLMRFQWTFLLIIPLAFMENVLREGYSRTKNAAYIMSVVTVFVMVFSYIVTDNIAYSNLQKKYEKTYAYCLRLADRIEQTEGYYQGIPIYLVGIVGYENYPTTDITESVTDHMLGIGGDYLFYTGENIEQFMKYYLGVTVNIVNAEDYDIYFEDWYNEMPAFPDSGSIKIVDGILCVKTENKRK